MIDQQNQIHATNTIKKIDSQPLRTRAAFGRSVNPHLFRDAAATTVAIHDPAHVRLAAPLLGHRTFATTERHYIRAQSLEAHREFADKIIDLRKQMIDEGQDQ